MKRTILVATLTLISVAFTFAQSKHEKEGLKFIADYDAAYLAKDISFAERVWAKNYLITTESGTKSNREESLAGAKNDLADANPKWKMVSYKSVNDWMHISGNTAIASGTYSSSVVPADNPAITPHQDNGRYTIVMEKQNGTWMVVAEHFTEAYHDKKMMEADVLKASDAYTAALKNKDRKMFERLLDDAYMYTDEDGSTRDKATDITRMVRAELKIDSNEVTDRKVRTIGNNGAVETGTYTVKGSNGGKPFDETGRYTTTWIARNGQWQIIADHSTTIKKK